MCNILVKKSGYTLVELMVTVAIAGIVLSMAIPSFVSVVNASRLTSYANDLVTALNLARSEAVKRGMQVTVRRAGATNSNWDGGWTVFTDFNNNGTQDGADVLLRVYPALTSGATLRTSNNYACWVAFNAVGLSRGSGTSCNGGLSNDTFRLCDNTATIATSIAIVVGPTGRVRTSDGTASSCP